MSTFEFVLSALVVLGLFFAFALALTAILLGTKGTQADVARLFQGVVKKLLGLVVR
jgi:ABC-type transport system involved in multi-copper enzyme maturation permease subunit